MILKDYVMARFWENHEIKLIKTNHGSRQIKSIKNTYGSR